jgi:hypothetical protein
MNTLRHINLSAAIIVLVCFFLPWEQVSCGGERDTLTGLDLARHGHPELWFIPLFVALVLLGWFYVRRPKRPPVLAVSTVVGGLVSAYLMNGERLRVQDEAGLIVAQLTGWFWLGFLTSLGVAASGITMLLSTRIITWRYR